MPRLASRSLPGDDVNWSGSETKPEAKELTGAKKTAAVGAGKAGGSALDACGSFCFVVGGTVAHLVLEKVRGSVLHGRRELHEQRKHLVR